MPTSEAVPRNSTNGWIQRQDTRCLRGRPFGYAAIAMWGIWGPVASAEGKIRIQIRDLDQTVIGILRTT